MVLSNPLKPSWNAGELSPRLSARVDFDKYKNGAAVLENLIPLAEGGAMRRSGTRYVAAAKSGTDTTNLKKFQFSTDQAYVNEFGDEYSRFFRNQGRITAGATDASVANGVFTDGSSSWNDASTGGGSISHSSSDGSLEFTLTSSSDVAIADQTITVSSSVIANEHILKLRLIGEAGDKMSLQIGATSSQSDILSATDKLVGYHAVPFTPNSTSFSLQFRYLGSIRVVDQPSSGSWTVNVNLDDVSIISDNILELQSPWGSSQVNDVQGPQSADVRYFFHNGTPPHKLTRLGHTHWSFEEVAWQDGPYLDVNTTTTTLAANSTDGRQITITASTTTGINDGDGFGADDVGRHIRVSNPSTSTDNWGWGVINGSTSTMTIRVNVKRDFPSTSATTEWRLGAWSDQTGWPGTATFHQQRLVAARSNEEPQTFWLSQTGDFENFAPDSPSSSEWEGDVEDDDGMSYTISSDDVETIEWLTAGTRLQIGTANAEWEVSASGQALTPTDIEVVRHTQYGSARVEPLRVGHATIFLQRAKRRLRELAFDFQADGLIANDLTRLAPHVTLGGVTEMALQQEPDSLVWAVREDGQLLSMTYRREEDVTAWSRHILGGSYGDDDAQVKSVETIPGSTASGQTEDSLDRDELWVLAKRTINGSTVQYVEFMERSYETGDDQQDSYYCDSLLTYDGSAATSVTGASHLAAESAKVLANGAVHPNATVSSSGVVTLQFESSVVQVGLGYTHRLKTFRLATDGTAGSAMAATRSIPEVTVSLMDSHRMKIGPSSSNLNTFDFREVGSAMDTAVPFFSGEHTVELEGDWSRDPRIVIEDDAPVPFTLLALSPKARINDVL